MVASGIGDPYAPILGRGRRRGFVEGCMEEGHAGKRIVRG